MKLSELIAEYPSFFDMELDELTDYKEALLDKLPDSDHARNFESYDELEAIETAIKLISA